MIPDEDILRIETRVLERGEGATPKNTAWLCNTIRNMKIRLEKAEKAAENAQSLISFGERFKALGKGWNLDIEKGSWVIYNDVGISFEGETIVAVLIKVESFVAANPSRGQERSRPPIEKQKRVKINLNDYIYFRLTKLGLSIIDQYYARFEQTLEPTSFGEYKLQLYEFCQIFGSHIHFAMGPSENPFATMNVEIEKS